eukprot:7120865-Prymnesium_polylepis.1
MAAEELALATRRWRWWSGAAASKTRIDAKKTCTTTRSKMRSQEAVATRERFAYLPFWRVPAPCPSESSP